MKRLSGGLVFFLSSAIIEGARADNSWGCPLFTIGGWTSTPSYAPLMEGDFLNGALVGWIFSLCYVSWNRTGKSQNVAII